MPPIYCEIIHARARRAGRAGLAKPWLRDVEDAVPYGAGAATWGCESSDDGRWTPPLRGGWRTPWGGRWTKERVVEDADPYGGQGRTACRRIYCDIIPPLQGGIEAIGDAVPHI